MAWQEGKVSLSFLKYQEQRDIQGLLKRKKRLYKFFCSAHVRFETEKEKTEQAVENPRNFEVADVKAIEALRETL